MAGKESDFIPVIRKTEDYGIFKALEGNREVLNQRKARVRNSINQIGLIPEPVIVNEKYEIIDGQARVEVCKELRIPVYYCVIPGLGVKECVTLNSTQTNWTLNDYINSLSIAGNENYTRLSQVLMKYPKLRLSVISALASETMTSVDGNTIKSGKFVFPEERSSLVYNTCEWLYQNIVPVKTQIKGRFDMLCYAVCFALEHTHVSHERLARVIQDNASRFSPLSTTVQALEEIERFYNYNIKKSKVYLATEYDKYCCERNFGYKNRWSREYGSRKTGRELE